MVLQKFQLIISHSELRPLDFMRTGVLSCAAGARGLCANVRAPTARFYPIASGVHFTLNLEQHRDSTSILEWALGKIDDSVHIVNWHSFNKRVIADDLQPSRINRPWLVYYHSPRCYRCHEMYADFAITGILLDAIQLGKVNCLDERGLCQHEHITSYPSLRLYLGRNSKQQFSSVVSIPVQDYASIVKNIKTHLQQYDKRLLADVKTTKSWRDEL